MRFLTTILALALLTGTMRADDSIIIVLDTSGSMGDYMREAQASRMEVAQKALIEVLSKVPDTTKVGLLTFDGWVYDLQPVDRTKLTAAIQGTRPGGGTPLYEYIRAAGTRLLEERQGRLNVGSYKLLVITDGEAGDDRLNEDHGGIPGVLKDIIGRNITVDAIGLDMSGDHSLKTKINGTYMRGDDADSLMQAVEKAVAEVGFEGDQDAGADAFAEIAELPDTFVVAALQGLTTFSNHPIGEKAPVPVVLDDGTVVMQPDPTADPVPELGEGGGLSSLMLLLAVIGIVAVIVVILVVKSMSGGYRY